MTDEYREFSEKPKSYKVYLVSAFWLILVGALAFAFIRSHQAADQRREQSTEVVWDEQLLACNNVTNAKPSDDFATCQQMAKEGWIDAALRMAWAYSRDGEYQSWQSAYEWLSWLSDYDEYAKLLSYVVLFQIGDSEEVKLSGERGIREMALANQPAASVYLASLYYLGLNTLERRSNIAWLINRAYEKSKYWMMPDKMAEIYVNGYLGEANTEKAKALLMNATNDNFPFHANNVAWLFATTNSQALADYPLALELAKKVVAEDVHADNYIYVDTLAAAYAANGHYDKAVATQEKALELILAEYENSDSPSNEIENFRTRLELFKSGQRYVEESADADAESFFKNLKDQVEQTLIENLYVEVNAPPIPEATN